MSATILRKAVAPPPREGLPKRQPLLVLCVVCEKVLRPGEWFSVSSGKGLKLERVPIQIRDGKVRVQAHKDGCVREDESGWVRSSRGVVISKGDKRVYLVGENGRIEVKR